MTNDAIGRLIENSARLRYLSVRKCYGLNLKTLDLKMRKSPSDLLKINTVNVKYVLFNMKLFTFILQIPFIRVSSFGTE